LYSKQKIINEVDNININGEFITHKAFGRGQVVEHGDGFVTVLFSGTDEKKKFIYPDAIETFLVLENEETAKLFKESSDVIARNKAIERKDEADRLEIEKNAIKEHAKSLKKASKKPKKIEKFEAAEDAETNDNDYSQS
jgi:hypothetical protein